MGRGVWACEGPRARLRLAPISLHERALSLRELFQPTEDMAEKCGRSLSHNTRRNSQTLSSFFLAYDPAEPSARAIGGAGH